MISVTRRLTLGLIGAGAFTILGSAAAEPRPTLLTIVDTPSGNTVRLSAADLDALPQHSISTHTDFTEGLTDFRGPRAVDVLALAGIRAAGDLRMAAANDYAVTVPFEDLARYGVLLATEMNGQRLNVRNRGPIWLMYPLDEHAELRSSVYNDRLIWQLVRIETH